jgi:periplasmic protein TonB
MHFENGSITMSDSALDNAAMYGGLPPPDWRAVAPTIGVRSIATIVLVVPLLLVAGVCWLHQMPSMPGPGTGGDVIEVCLVGPQADNAQGQDVSEPAKAGPTPAADPSTDDREQAIPVGIVAPPPEPQRPPPTAVSSVPAPSARPPQGVLNQKALMFQRALLAHIIRYRQDPDGARFGRVSVQLVFSMLRDGTVTDVRIASSSGNAILDDAAVRTIRLAQPMPKIPAELPEPFEIQVPITFNAN